MIKTIDIADARFELKNGAGSDAVHKDPQYAYAVTRLADGQGATGAGLALPSARATISCAAPPASMQTRSAAGISKT